MTAQISTIRRQDYFPTMIFSATAGEETDSVNAGLLSAIYAARESDRRGIQRSNFSALGSWHSQNYLHREAAFAPMVEMVTQLTRHMAGELGYAASHELRIGTMWAIINPPGAFNRAHIHPDCLWSGVYYVQAPADCGQIEFIDPRTQHLMRQPVFEAGVKRPPHCWTKVNVRPAAGKLLIFPAWLYHAVHPNLSAEPAPASDRVIISFNLSHRRRG